MNIPLFLEQTDVAEKIKNAPDSSYKIGVVIGTFIPFVILIGIAYWMYNRAKKRDENGY
jgi:ATP-dependent Zn protease